MTGWTSERHWPFFGVNSLSLGTAEQNYSPPVNNKEVYETWQMRLRSTWNTNEGGAPAERMLHPYINSHLVLLPLLLRRTHLGVWTSQAWALSGVGTRAQADEQPHVTDTSSLQDGRKDVRLWIYGVLSNTSSNQRLNCDWIIWTPSIVACYYRSTPDASLEIIHLGELAAYSWW